MGDNDSRLGRRDFVRGIGAAGAISVTGLSGCSALSGAVGGGPSTYTIAATVPQSGQYSDVGQAMQRGYEFGASGENADSTIAEFFNNADLNVDVRDSESDPSVVTEQLEAIQSENDDGVHMVWGGYGNEQSMAAASFAEEQGVPCFLPYFPYEQPHAENSYEWSFGTGLKSSNIALGTAEFLDDMSIDDRPSRVAIWEPNSDWGTEMADSWETQLAEANNQYEVVAREGFEPGSTDLSGPVSAAAEADAQVVLSNPSLPSAVAAIEAMQSAEFSPTMVQLSWGADRPSWWSELGSTGSYVLSTPGWVQGSTREGTVGFLDRFGNTHGYSAEEGDLIPPAAGTTFGVTQVVRNAFQENDPFDAEDVRSTLRDLQLQTVVGQLEYSADTNGVPATDGLAAAMAQWWDGEEFEAGQRRALLGRNSFSGVQFKYPLPPWSER